MLYVPSLLQGLLSPPHKAWQGQGSVALVADPVTLSQPREFPSSAQGWEEEGIVLQRACLAGCLSSCPNGMGFIALPAPSLKITQLKLVRKIYAFQQAPCFQPAQQRCPDTAQKYLCNRNRRSAPRSQGPSQTQPGVLAPLCALNARLARGLLAARLARFTPLFRSCGSNLPACASAGHQQHVGSPTGSQTSLVHVWLKQIPQKAG